MNNIMLGKVLKAMYKLSGKTLPQLSDETDLTVDTINNLFYARVQKPGLIGVNALVNAMGFSIQQLVSFLEAYPDLTEDADVTELFTVYLSVEEKNTNIPVYSTKEPARHTKGSLSNEIELMNTEHEKQLDRFRATHQRYVEELKAQHNRQIEQMREHEAKAEQHFDKSISALKESHVQELSRMESEHTRQRKLGRFLFVVVNIETLLLLLLLILDMINHNIGWLR